MLPTSTLLWVIQWSPTMELSIYYPCVCECAALLMHHTPVHCMPPLYFHSSSSSFSHTPHTARDSTHSFAERQAWLTRGICDHRLDLFSPPVFTATGVSLLSLKCRSWWHRLETYKWCDQLGGFLHFYITLHSARLQVVCSLHAQN